MPLSICSSATAIVSLTLKDFTYILKTFVTCIVICILQDNFAPNTTNQLLKYWLKLFSSKSIRLTN